MPLFLVLSTVQAAEPSHALLVRLEAKPDKSEELEQFLKKALTLAKQEESTRHWFALKLGPTTFGIFDTFMDEEGRQAHLHGEIATALKKKSDELLATPPDIRKVDLLAVKSPE